MTRPHDGYERVEVMTTRWIAGIIGREVARDDVRSEARAAVQRAVYVHDDSGTGWPEILAAIYIGGLIELRGSIVGREQIRIVPGQVFICGIGPMATVAIYLRVDNETSESNQIPIFAICFEERRRDA